MRLQLVLRPKAVLALAAVLSAGGEARAQDMRLRLDTMVYHDDDHVNVVSPQVAASAALDDDGGEASATAVVDIVSAASVDVVSEATPGFIEVRQEADLRVSKHLGAWLPGLRYRYSHEPDYVSHGGGAHFERRLGSADTTLIGGFDLTHDDVLRHGTAAADFSRTLWSAAGEIGLTQVIDARTLVHAVYTLTVQDGYLEKPYRYVPLFDAAGLAAASAAGEPLSLATFDTYRLPERPPENVPDLRVRHALGLRGVRYLEAVNGSFRLDYRIYLDDWGMWSHTGEAGLRVGLGDSFLAGLTSRTYYQTSVSFWQRAYEVSGAGVAPEWRTVDKELSRSLSETVAASAELRTGRFTWEGDVAATYERFYDYLFLDSRTAYVLRLGVRYDR